ncbi:MAG: HAD family hydrolase [Nocardioidaceae bacterium]
MTPRLVALDIDGTLVDAHGLVSRRVLDAVTAVADAGAHIVVATGRSAFATWPVIRALGLTDGHAVASNGAVTFTHPPVRVTSRATFDARPAVELVLQHVPGALVAVEVVGDGYRINRHFPAGEISGPMTLQSVDQLVSEPVTRVIIRDPRSSAQEFQELAEKIGLHGINYYVGYTAWLDLAPEGVSKASGLVKVAAELGVSASDVLAIGDGRNDLEMLSWAGRGVAMGQAPDEVKAVADDVTGTIEADGVASELDRWFPLESTRAS